MRLERVSLRRKFALVFVGFSLALTVGGGLWALHVTTRALESELDERLLSMAETTAGAALRGQEIFAFRRGTRPSPSGFSGRSACRGS